MNLNEKIHIAFACDDNYAQHAGVAITSLREQQRSGLPVEVHLLDGGISPENLRKLDQLKDNHLDIKIYRGDMKEYSNYLTATYISSAAYLRLSIERLLPKNINRIIYCDCDIIFLKPIDELWSIDLGSHWLAAVNDPNPDNKFRKDLGIDLPGQYFNSGILLIDLNSWRANQVCSSVNDFLRSNWDNVRYWDQDGLNAILHKRWLSVDVRWNTLTCAVDKKKLPEPAIVHYATEFKPWFYKSLDPFQNEYFYYLKLTPWNAYQFPDKNMLFWIRRMIILNTPEAALKVIFFITYQWRKSSDERARQKALIRTKGAFK